MRCFNHDDREAVGACKACSKGCAVNVRSTSLTASPAAAFTRAQSNHLTHSQLEPLVFSPHPLAPDTSLRASTP